MSRCRCVAIAVAVAVSAGCAAQSPPIIPDGGIGDGGASDGGPDAAPLCSASIQVLPQVAVAPLAMLATVELGAPPGGAVSYEWIVYRIEDGGANDVAWTPRNDAATQIDIDAALPGIYHVEVDVHDRTESCAGTARELNVGAAGALSAGFRLRLVPPPSAAPVQELAVSVPGGIDYLLGDLTLDGGQHFAGSVTDEGGAPVVAYLRFTPSGGGPAVERFAGIDGAWAARLDATTSYRVLVVPAAADLPPRTLSYVPTGPTDLVISTGVAVEGVVEDDDGAPIAGAVVSLRIAGTPSTLAVTDAAGGFTLRARPGGAVEIVVVPPEGSGLPRLELAAAALPLEAPLVIRFVASSPRLLAGVVLHGTEGEILDHATVTVHASLAAAGTVTAGVDQPLTMRGVVRASAVTAADGALPALAVPAAAYRVVIERAGAATRTAAVDLTAEVPALLVAAPAISVGGRVTNRGGAGLVGLRVTATPAAGSDLAGDAQAIAVAITDDDGDFALALAPQPALPPPLLAYELAVAPSASSLVAPARRAVAVDGPSPIALPAFVLADALRVTGRVSQPGLGGTGGVSVEMWCLLCDGLAAAEPLGQAVTASDGDFVVVVPDPGVAP